MLNAANEVAVKATAEGRLTFNQIVPTVADALEAHTPMNVDSVETLLEADAWARNRVGALAV